MASQRSNVTAFNNSKRPNMNERIDSLHWAEGDIAPVDRAAREDDGLNAVLLPL